MSTEGSVSSGGVGGDVEKCVLRVSGEGEGVCRG